MISINYRDSKPIYEQIRDSIRTLILSGAIAGDEKLPSVRDLASEHAINPNTIQRAYRDLEMEGYIYSIPGKGSFAAHELVTDYKRIGEIKEKLMSNLNELKMLGVTKNELLVMLESVYVKEE